MKNRDAVSPPEKMRTKKDKITYNASTARELYSPTSARSSIINENNSVSTPESEKNVNLR